MAGVAYDREATRGASLVNGSCCCRLSDDGGATECPQFHEWGLRAMENGDVAARR